MPEQQRQRLRLKIKHGGFGLASAAETSPIAHASSLISSANVLSEPLVLGNLGLQTGTKFREDATHAINRTRQLVSSSDAVKLLPPREELAGDRPTVLNWIKENTKGADALPKKLQSILSHAADRQRLDNMLRTANKLEIATLLGASAKHSAAWLAAIPSERSLHLSNKHFSYASRMRLGLPINDEKITGCSCNTTMANLASTCTMLSPVLACAKLKSTSDTTPSTISSWMLRANVAAPCCVNQCRCRVRNAQTPKLCSQTVSSC
jgi:hypothetical protein